MTNGSDRLETLRRHLRGVTAFPITPYDSDLEVDLGALRRNVEWMIERGIRSLVAAGGTGELYSLTVEEAAAVHRTVIEAAAGRAAVICGVGGKQREAIALARKAEAAGATGILMLPAAYGAAPDDGMLAYYGGIARSVGIGVLPYARDWAIFSPDLLARLAEEPNVVAYKDGSADLRLVGPPAGPRRRPPGVGGGRRRRHGAHLLRRRGGGLHLQRGQLHAPGLPRPLRRGEQRGLRPRPRHLRGQGGGLLRLAGPEAGLRGVQRQGGDGDVRTAKPAPCGPRSRRWGRRT